jgi:YD repeat-containing protein
VTTSIDQLGHATSRGYDNNSRIVSTVDPTGGTTTYSYDADGRPAAVTAPAGGTDATVHDLAGNVIKSTSAIGGVSTYTYDDDGRVATAVDPRGNAPGANPADFTVTYGYDAASNLTAIGDQVGDTTSFAYDANNRVTAATDANGHTTSYKYLDDDTQQSVVGPDGDTKHATTYTYDNAANVVARTDAAGNSRYTYDKLGRVTDVKDPLNRHTTFAYDPEGNLSQTIAPGDTPATARTIAYTYDILNRLTRQDQGGGALVHTFGWDGRNRLASVVDPTGTRTQSYDDLGRLSVVSRGDQTFTYGYDADSNVTSRTWPDGTTITATYAADDRLKTLTAQGGQAGPAAATYGFTYDPSGRLIQTTAPTANHLTTDRTYDRAGRLSDLDSHTDAGVVAHYQITRDRRVEVAHCVDLGVVIAGQECSGAFAVSEVVARPHVGHTWPQSTDARAGPLNCPQWCTRVLTHVIDKWPRGGHTTRSTPARPAPYHNLIHADNAVIIDVVDRSTVVIQGRLVSDVDATGGSLGALGAATGTVSTNVTWNGNRWLSGRAVDSTSSTVTGRPTGRICRYRRVAHACSTLGCRALPGGSELLAREDRPLDQRVRGRWFADRPQWPALGAPAAGTVWLWRCCGGLRIWSTGPRTAFCLSATSTCS